METLLFTLDQLNQAIKDAQNVNLLEYSYLNIHL